VIGNTHEKIGKDHACGSGDMLADRRQRQTDTHTHSQTCSLQYSTTAAVGKVMIVELKAPNHASCPILHTPANFRAKALFHFTPTMATNASNSMLYKT